MKRPLLNVDANDDLLCPNCSVSNLHIYTASIVMKQVSVSAHGDSIVVPADSFDGNAAPSSGRGSMVEVIFLCEGCGQRSAVGFSFHKGHVQAGVHVLPKEPADAYSDLLDECLWRD